MSKKENKKALKWRLQKQLTFDEVTSMLDKKIITADEAKELLFNLTDEKEKIKELEKANEALQEQIDFLQNVVDKLSTRQPAQVIYKYIEDWSPRFPVYPMRPYYQAVGGSVTITAGTTSGSLNSTVLASNVMDKLKTNYVGIN